MPWPVSSLDAVQSISSPVMTLVIHTRQHLKRGCYYSASDVQTSAFLHGDCEVRRPGSSIENTSAYVRENCWFVIAHLPICASLHSSTLPSFQSPIHLSTHQLIRPPFTYLPLPTDQPIHLPIHSHLLNQFLCPPMYSSTNPSTHPFTHLHIYLLYIPPSMYLHSILLCLTIYVFICTPIYPSIYQFTHPPVYPPTHSFTYSSVHHFLHLCTHPLMHPFTSLHLHVYLCIHPSTHSLIHSLTHPPTHWTWSQLLWGLV